MKKEIISIEKFEIELYNKKYFILVYKKTNDFYEFYITEEDNSIISFCVGSQITDITPTIEEFIGKNIINWLYLYNKELDVLEEHYVFLKGD